jgi:hypothetical protein
MLKSSQKVGLLLQLKKTFRLKIAQSGHPDPLQIQTASAGTKTESSV